jgi:hypothetical protein
MVAERPDSGTLVFYCPPAESRGANHRSLDGWTRLIRWQTTHRMSLPTAVEASSTSYADLGMSSIMPPPKLCRALPLTPRPEPRHGRQLGKVHPLKRWARDAATTELKKIWQSEAGGRISRWRRVRAGLVNDSGTYDCFTQAIVGKEHTSRGDCGFERGR